MTTCDPVSQEVGTAFAEEANKEVVPTSLGSSSSLYLTLSTKPCQQHQSYL